MVFRKRADQQLFDKLTDELTTLYVEAEAIQNKITWRANRLNALIRRTRCRDVCGCRHEHKHAGAHHV